MIIKRSNPENRKYYLDIQPYLPGEFEKLVGIVGELEKRGLGDEDVPVLHIEPHDNTDWEDFKLDVEEGGGKICLAYFGEENNGDFPELWWDANNRWWLDNNILGPDGRPRRIMGTLRRYLLEFLHRELSMHPGNMYLRELQKLIQNKL